MASAHDFTFTTIDNKPLDMKDFAGKPVLVVNVASYCGFTPQYADLEKLHETYGPKGLVVLGVPSNDFGAQEPKTEPEIAKFCETMYGVKFPLTAKQKVVGMDAHGAYQWISGEAGEAAAPKWNFHKYLIGKDGSLKGAWPSRVRPGSSEITGAIEADFKGLGPSSAGVADLREHRVEHLGRQPAGVRVVARAMIAVGQRQAGRQRMQPVVDEGIAAGRPDGQRAQDLVVRALAQGDDDLEIGHHRQLGLQERPAHGELDGQRLVLGRQAAHGIGDAAVDEVQPVVGIGAIDSLGEAELQQGRVEQVAGIVAGERPAGAVGAAHSGREPDDQQARVEVAERTDRRVLPIGICPELVPEGDEPRDSADSRVAAPRNAAQPLERVD